MFNFAPIYCAFICGKITKNCLNSQEIVCLLLHICLKMDIELKEIHVGEVIKKRIEELNMTKSEFGRRAGISQQHVNRVLERETMETSKLVKICRILDINIFAQFCSFPTNINAYLAAVTMSGDAKNVIGDAGVLAELEMQKKESDGYQRDVMRLEEMVRNLKSQLDDKNMIIELLKKENTTEKKK